MYFSSAFLSAFVPTAPVFIATCNLIPLKNQNFVGMSVAYLVVSLKTYQQQDVYMRGDAEKEKVKEQLTNYM